MGKSLGAFRTISEVSQELGVPNHVLKFWEGKFTQVRPMKRGGGRRYYRKRDVELLLGIRQLLYRDRFTIKGVKKILQEQGVHFVMNYWKLSKQGNDVFLHKIQDLTARTAHGTAQPGEPELGKSLDAFRTISEVSQDLNVPIHVLRFWEGKFTQLRSVKRGGRRLYYGPEDIDLLLGLRQLLYNDRYTIEGAQKILQEQGVHFVTQILPPGRRTRHHEAA